MAIRLQHRSKNSNNTTAREKKRMQSIQLALNRTPLRVKEQCNSCKSISRFVVAAAAAPFFHIFICFLSFSPNNRITNHLDFIIHWTMSEIDNSNRCKSWNGSSWFAIPIVHIKQFNFCIPNWLRSSALTSFRTGTN